MTFWDPGEPRRRLHSTHHNACCDLGATYDGGEPCPHVSCIVVNRNTRDLLRECLKALEGEVVQTATWVVDNASTDGSVELVRDEFSTVNLVANHDNIGYAAANNQALVAVRTPYVLLLNADALVPAGGVAHLAEILDVLPGAAVIGPRYVYPDGEFQASYADFPSLGAEVLQAFGLARRLVRPWFPSYGPSIGGGLRSVDWVPGACMMVRMAAVEDTGLLDEGFFFYGEEVDWCYRFGMRGWSAWYDPSIAVVHCVGQSSRQEPLARRWHLSRARLRFFAKHRGAHRAGILKVVLMLTLALHALRGATHHWAGDPSADADWNSLLGLVPRLLCEPVSVRCDSTSAPLAP